MNFQAILKKARLTTGPSLRRETRHSNLSVLKAFILGESLVVTKLKKSAYNLGTAVHEKYLKGKNRRKLTPEDRKHYKGMLAALERSPIARRLFAGTIKEKRIRSVINGVRIGGTPDARKPIGKDKNVCAYVNDLKTTACTTFAAFLITSFKYGYFRQGVTYMIFTKAREYFLVGVSKIPPYRVFIFRLQDYPDLLRYAEQELKFLLYFYKRYGNPKRKKAP